MLNPNEVARRAGGVNLYAIAKLTALITFSIAVIFIHFGNAPTPIAHFRFHLIPAPPEPAAPSAFEQESAMSPKELLDRWTPFVMAASQRFHVPQSWVRAIMSRESGGRTMMGENAPITSDAGAVGLMQLEPETYADMRAQYGLGPDALDPRDNIFAGAAYLRFLYEKYGYPRMFAAYNDGPGNFERSLAGRHTLPRETVAYLGAITTDLGDAPHLRHGRRHATRAA